MHRHSDSPSPSRKRMRLSSPTFDDQVEELSQDDIRAFDCLDAQLPQSFAEPSRSTDRGHLHVKNDADPFWSENPRATERIHAAFISASAIASSQPESEPPDNADDEPPPEVDYAAWFNSDSPTPFVGFNAASTTVPSFQRPPINGESVKLFVPSSAALREAEEKMRRWEEDVHPTDPVPTPKEFDPPQTTQPMSPPRPKFSSARNAISTHPPQTPTSFVEPAHARSHTSLQTLGGMRQPKPFKSPLVTAAPSLSSHRQVSTPNISSPLRTYHSSAATPSQVAAPISPLRPSLLANHATAQQPLGFTPVHGRTTTRPKFVTPFKAIAKSGTPRATVAENQKPPSTPLNPGTIVKRIYPPSAPSSRPNSRNSSGRMFNLAPPSDRRTLATSGLRPRAYSARQLAGMGINVRELSRVHPRSASSYTFTTISHSSLGRSAALEELHAKSCTLATQPWVDNHWSLVLWKMAGMVVLDPMSEDDPSRKRWCWPEVMRQFMYRYERDLNSSSRPPLRLITIRDASAGSPMVLCISDIIWPTIDSEGAVPVPNYPELEVTDGWYRLRARIDAPLARGVKKGKIKVGRKIAVAGAKLSAERKEGSEILEAYNSNVLVFTGNSTHMAPWHAKLGFQRGPFVATLNSLTADGGNVVAMMLTIKKAYPVAYIEFIEDTDGRKQREGPHDAKEELKLCIQWKMKRESHASKLWCEYEKHRLRLVDCAERLEQRVGSTFRPKDDDGPPDKIYDIYDTLQEDAQAAKGIITSISHEDAGWLARHIRAKAVQERDEVVKEIEQELKLVCPARDVKAFCVIVASDTRTYKHPPKRTAQVTVWDVPGASAPEGCTQSPFVPGQQYFVTNLVPTQTSAWMDCSSGDVYLSAGKNSKWTLIN